MALLPQSLCLSLVLPPGIVGDVTSLRFLTGKAAKQAPELRGKDVAIPELSRDQALKFDPPDYPGGAQQKHLEGVCAMHVVVSADGQPRKIEITQSTGTPDLDDACLNIIRTARFIPAERDGQPVAAATDIWLAWRLNAKGPSQPK